MSNHFIKTVSIGTLLLLCCSCMTTERAYLSTTEIPVYMQNKPVQKYEEKVYIEVSGTILSSKKRLLKKLITKASKEQVDALVNLNYKYVGFYPICEAIGVKYK